MRISPGSSACSARAVKKRGVDWPSANLKLNRRPSVSPSCRSGLRELAFSVISVGSQSFICESYHKTEVNPMTEDEFAAEVMRRFKGRIVLALGAAAAIGFVLGALVL
jgi:hypothetical protein